MKRRKAIAAVLAAVLSLVSASAAYAEELSEQEMTEVLEQEPTEQETAEPPQEDAAEQLSYGKVVDAAEDAESLEGEYIPVLMYHHFAIRNMGVGNGVVTTTKELEDHLHYFQSQGYKIISLEELDSLLTATERDTMRKVLDLVWERNISVLPWMTAISAIMIWHIRCSKNIVCLRLCLQ